MTTTRHHSPQHGSICCQQARDDISRHAYFAYLDGGSRDGNCVQNWLAAEAQVKARYLTEKHAHHDDHHAASASAR